jgi:hypothetical protein
MSHLFDIPETQADLPKNNHGNTSYRQIAPSHAVNNGGFGSGDLKFRFGTSSASQWWVPSKSFFVIRTKLTSGDNRPLRVEDDITYAMNMCGNLFQNMYIRLGGKVISSIPSDFAKIDTLMQRKERAGVALTGMGHTTNTWGSYEERLHAVAVNGKTSRNSSNPPRLVPLDELIDPGVNPPDAAEIPQGDAVIAFTWNAPQALDALSRFMSLLPVGTMINTGVGSIGGVTALSAEIIDDQTVIVLTNTIVDPVPDGGGGAPRPIPIGGIQLLHKHDLAAPSTIHEHVWQPPSSLFYSYAGAIPQSGEVEISLHPTVNYYSTAIESRGANKTLGDNANNYKFEIVDMFFYVMETRGPQFNGNQFILDLDEMRVQPKELGSTPVGGSLATYQFTVPKTTRGLTVAFADKRYATDTRVTASLFHGYDANITHTLGSKQSLRCKQLQLSYTGRQFPEQIAEMSYTGIAPLVANRLTHRYVENLINRGDFDAEGHVETFEEWLQRGPYYYFPVDKDSLDENTAVSVKVAFDATGAELANTTMYLWAHYRNIVIVRLTPDRRVLDVSVSDT